MRFLLIFFNFLLTIGYCCEAMAQNDNNDYLLLMNKYQNLQALGYDIKIHSFRGMLSLKCVKTEVGFYRKCKNQMLYQFKDQKTIFYRDFVLTIQYGLKKIYLYEQASNQQLFASQPVDFTIFKNATKVIPLGFKNEMGAYTIILPQQQNRPLTNFQIIYSKTDLLINKLIMYVEDAELGRVEFEFHNYIFLEDKNCDENRFEEYFTFFNRKLIPNQKYKDFKIIIY